MALNEFGKAMQKLRIEHGVSQKEMAAEMKMGSTYLSALEHGERPLNEDHIRRAVAFWEPRAKQEEIAQLRQAGAGTTKVLDTSQDDPQSRIFVMQVLRRLREGKKPTPEMLQWAETDRGELEGGM